MANSKVVSFKNLPARLPFTQTVLAYLLLDKFHAPGWVIGTVWTLVGIIWIATIYGIIHQDQVELNELRDKQ